MTLSVKKEEKSMQKYYLKILSLKERFFKNVKRILKNDDGDQITGWLIVVLLVVVVGAFFLNTYQSTITQIWSKIVDKIYATFGI